LLRRLLRILGQRGAAKETRRDGHDNNTTHVETAHAHLCRLARTSGAVMPDPGMALMQFIAEGSG
jgi:hypothetical protein